MTLTQINALTLQDLIDDVLNKLYDATELPFGDVLYTILPDTGTGFYGRIQLNSAFKLAPIEVLQDEKDLIKQGLIAVEEKRLAQVAADAEAARVLDLQTRLSVITNYHTRAQAIGKFQSNQAVEYKRIIDENDITTLQELEAQEAIDAPIEAKRIARQAKKENGKKRKKVCDDCLDIVRDFNTGKTGADVDAMKAAFLLIYTRLQDGSPVEAKLLIQAIPYDGIIDTLKDDLLDELTEGGF